MIVERFDSVILRQVLGNSSVDAPPGSFLAGYTFDRAGLITRVVVEAGDIPPR
jgi:hypothetical protein